ncbi:MAG: phospholipase D-like domain-containing protein [Actinomycetota bacterium]|nr:phospholipase D-like domain-containing protein [Actinomycetota bacterium]
MHDPNHASLHAKGAIADDRLAFVTSANLTEYALDRNIELGLLVRGGEVPRQLARHFDRLVATGVLVKAR